MSSSPAREPVVLSWSGGKDSSLALHALRQSRDVEVIALLTTVTQEYGRISMHGVRRSLLEQQAEALGLPLHIVWIKAGSDNASYESQMRAKLEAFKGQGVGRVAFGDLFLQEVRQYREERLAQVGMSGLFPLWGMDTAALAKQFIGAGFRAVLTCVDSTQLDGSFSGRRFDASLLEDLPPTVDPCGENGEFHTFVFDGPIFARAVPCETGERVLRDNRFAYCDVVSPQTERAVADGQRTN
jgi:uncharacterized protein (TIGR00290 family)